ncbi:hypothetical protein DFH07DRAFT_790132 [Mycena maculata]|uniref:Uncharacterized protein n=1 Tax=Mycena maculata TaxID=230809 RepID=A0AAD7KD45_9AGAR|nr:hypothetical protein DFH07DRAFT_790132 [Mycena maculata]
MLLFMPASLSCVRQRQNCVTVVSQRTRAPSSRWRVLTWGSTWLNWMSRCVQLVVSSLVRYCDLASLLMATDTTLFKTSYCNTLSSAVRLRRRRARAWSIATGYCLTHRTSERTSTYGVRGAPPRHRVTVGGGDDQGRDQWCELDTGVWHAGEGAFIELDDGVTNAHTGTGAYTELRGRWCTALPYDAIWLELPKGDKRDWEGRRSAASRMGRFQV